MWRRSHSVVPYPVTVTIHLCSVCCIYSLFNDAVSSSEYITLDVRLVSEQWGNCKLRGMERSWPIWGNILPLGWRYWGRSLESRIASVLGELWTRNVLSTKMERYPFDQDFRQITQVNTCTNTGPEVLNFIERPSFLMVGVQSLHLGLCKRKYRSQILVAVLVPAWYSYNFAGRTEFPHRPLLKRGT
jgi:hypothetical protein